VSTITELQKEISDWADTVFPERTAHGALVKLMTEEIPELCLCPDSAGEFADCVVLLFDIATLNGIDIATAVRDKMAINRQRTWAIDHSTGLMRHVDGHGPAMARHLAKRGLGNTQELSDQEFKELIR